MIWALLPLSADDLDAVMAIEAPVFGSDAWSASLMREELASPHCRYVGARGIEHDELIGYGGVLCPRGAREADIQTIAVAESARGRGLGRAIMLALMDESRARGAREVFLEVREDNPIARGLYASLGFEEIGSRPHYYQPDDVAAVIMRLRLSLAHAEGGPDV